MQDDPLSETQRPAQRGSEYSCWAWQHPGRYYKHVDHLADVITDVSDISLSQEPTDESERLWDVRGRLLGSSKLLMLFKFYEEIFKICYITLK